MDRWQEQLDELEAKGMRRSLRTIGTAQGPRVELEGRQVLLLCSNNYLGLANHPALVEAALAATAAYGVGSGASRLISGSMVPHVQLEEKMASFKGTSGALLFNCGYGANTGILQGLFGENDLIFSDALNHASIIDGCRLSRARTVVYPHRDLAALEELMRAETPRRKGEWLVVTDGVFSMDGDLAPLPGLVELKERFDAMLMVDDAHGTGVIGSTGRGTAEKFGCLNGIDLHMGTFGKGLGCAGAYLAADRTLIDILVNRSRPFIFSTSLPPAVAASACAALDLVESPEGARRRQRLAENRELFVQVLQERGMDLLGSESQIVPVFIGEPAATMSAMDRLLEAGVFLQGIRPPTVPVDTCRLRATVMADHRPEELCEAAGLISGIVKDRI